MRRVRPDGNAAPAWVWSLPLVAVHQLCQLVKEDYVEAAKVPVPLNAGGEHRLLPLVEDAMHYLRGLR